MIVFPVKIIMSPTCSSRFFVGRKARSATARTTRVSSQDHGACAGRTRRASEAYGIAASTFNWEPSRQLRLNAEPRCKLRRTLGGMAAQRRNAALSLSLAGALALAVSSCGGGPPRQDAKEPKGDFPVRVVSATFPGDQKLAKDSTMEIVVENAGQKTVPLISVTVKCKPGLGGSFQTAIPEETGDEADPSRPQFVVNKIPTAGPRQNPPLDPAPLERSSAYVDTFPLGPLAPGKRATFTWDVTAVKAGEYKLCWRVNAGLYGKAKAVPAPDGGPINGQFAGEISREAPKSRIAEDGETVIDER
jgi:hypothetical protein